MEESETEDSDAESPAEIPEKPDIGMIKLARYANNEDAEFFAAILRGQGIPAKVFGANFHAMENSSFADVELYVPIDDVGRASDLLARPPANDAEPAEEDENAPAVDHNGRRMVVAFVCERTAELQDAETTLASARISSTSATRFTTAGKKFVVRVAEDDLAAARELLSEDAGETAGQSRCPKCGAWRVHAISGFFAEIASAFGFNRTPRAVECLSCHYRGPYAEFTNRGVANE